jgi:uncharacterized protein YcfJ
MKKLAIAMASIFTVVAPVADAAYDRYGNWYNDGYQSARERQEFARVIESRPVYEASNRREECWNPRAGHFEERRETRDSTKNGTVAGALLGGVLGHQIDSGAGTVGGALLGGIIGNQIDKGHNSNPQDDLDYSRCRIVGDSGRNLQGYDVRYAYRGREYVTRMDRQPGQRLRLGDDIREDGTPLN